MCLIAGQKKGTIRNNAPVIQLYSIFFHKQPRISMPVAWIAIFSGCSRFDWLCWVAQSLLRGVKSSESFDRSQPSLSPYWDSLSTSALENLGKIFCEQQQKEKQLRKPLTNINTHLENTCASSLSQPSINDPKNNFRSWYPVIICKEWLAKYIKVEE